MRIGWSKIRLTVHFINKAMKIQKTVWWVKKITNGFNPTNDENFRSNIISVQVSPNLRIGLNTFQFENRKNN